MDNGAADDGGRVLAVTSVSLGAAAVALSFTIFGVLLGPAAIITGGLALRRPGARKAFAIAGIVMGSIAILVLLIALAGLVLYMRVGGDPAPG